MATESAAPTRGPDHATPPQLTTKVTPPLARPVPRPRLIKRRTAPISRNAWERPPAGFGKTTLVTACARIWP